MTHVSHPGAATDFGTDCLDDVYNRSVIPFTQVSAFRRYFGIPVGFDTPAHIQPLLLCD